MYCVTSKAGVINDHSFMEAMSLSKYTLKDVFPPIVLRLQYNSHWGLWYRLESVRLFLDGGCHLTKLLRTASFSLNFTVIL